MGCGVKHASGTLTVHDDAPQVLAQVDVAARWGGGAARHDGEGHQRREGPSDYDDPARILPWLCLGDGIGLHKFFQKAEYLVGAFLHPQFELLPCVVDVLLDTVFWGKHGKGSKLLVRVRCATGIATTIQENNASVVFLGEWEESCENS